MKEQKIARAYAQSIFQLGEEQNIKIADELTQLTEVINENNDFETLLFLDVFTVEEKTDILGQVMGKMNLSTMTKSFLLFMTQEKRINLFPMVYKEVIVMDDHKKGFLRGTIEGASDNVDEAFQKTITTYLKEKLGIEPNFNFKKNNNLTAGYRVTVEDLQLDASLDNQLNKFKEEILNN